MQIKRFEAETMPQALDMVKNAFGPHAVILSVKSEKKDAGLFKTIRKTRVEIVAAVDTNPTEKNGGSESSIQLNRKAVSLVQGNNVYQMPKNNFRPENGSPVESHDIPRPLLKSLFSIHRQMICQGVDKKTGCRLIRRLYQIASVRKNIVHNDLQAILNEILDGIHPEKHRLHTNSCEPHVIALLGPNGSGKTTTLSKLALAYRYRMKKKVALISLDNTTFGGITKLKTLADIMGIPTKPAADAASLQRALYRFRKADVILIDTPGVSPGDKREAESLKVSLDSIRPVEVHLVLSATDREADLESAVQRFKPFGINWTIFTKLDLSNEKGTLLNHVMAECIPISYITFGTKIHGNISRGTSDKLIGQVFQSNQESLIWATPPEVLAEQLSSFEDLLNTHSGDSRIIRSFDSTPTSTLKRPQKQIPADISNVVRPLQYHQGRLH
jgi:flagellar biosynthesis protein FlhF